MDEDEESFTTFLAYTKSPKTAKRTSFQDELKKAVSARVSRQKAIEEADYSDYSDEFESDDSLDDSFKKTKTIKTESQKSFHDFHFSDDEDEDSHSKVSFLKTRKQDNKEPDYNLTDGSIRKGDYERILPKSPLPGDMKNGGLLSEGHKPTPKPRESRMKRSPSPLGSGISTLDGDLKPTPQDTSRDKTEGKHTTNKPVSVSAPSSLTRRNDKVSASEAQSFSETYSPEVLQLSNSPSPTARLTSPAITAVQKDIAKEEEPGSLKALKIREFDGHGNTESHVSEEDPPSVLQMMLSSVKEKSARGENKDVCLSETHEIYNSSEQDKMLGDKHSQNELNLQKKREEFLKLGTSQSSRSIAAEQTKKSFKHRRPNSAKSRYLGTLTVLDKSAYENNGEIEAADTLRATVYQNWLEKKKVFLHEVHKNKKAEAEEEKEKLKLQNVMKKEEAMSAFMAWKSEKKKEIKEIRVKQKLEEKKNMEEIQDIACKKEDCRKAFEKWKASKEDHLKEKALKEKDLEREKKQNKQKMITEKKSNNMTAFTTWNDRKELVLKEKKKEKKCEKLKLEKTKSEKNEKEQRALEIYEQWLEKKEQQEKMEKQRKLKVILDDDPPPPWSPPGKTIPAGR